jgi:hypothetical protein
MRLVLDTGALIALENGDRAMWTRLKATQLAGEISVTHGGVVGQAWRGGGARQALLAKALAGVEVRALDDALGRAAGGLLDRAKKHDVVDAAIVLLSNDGDRIVTSDPGDLEPLAAAAGRHVDLIRS